MIKALILMNLVFFTFEIDHCFEVETSCKKCISGYKLVNSRYGAYCEKEEDFNRESGNIDHCLYSYGGHCYACEKGYAPTTDGRCKENTIHCSLFNGDTCTKCESYYKLTEGKCEKSTCYSFDEEDGECECEDGYYYNDKGGCSKIPIAYCEEGNATYCEKCKTEYYTDDKGSCSKIPIQFCKRGNANHCSRCEDYYYVNDQGKCEKIPIDFCLIGNATYCDSCHGKYELSEDSKKCTLREGEEEEEDNAPDGGNIANCYSVNKKDKTICDECNDNYDWDSTKKECIYLCDGDTEQYCDECNENYNSYDYGKTCEKIDPEYTSPSEKEDGAKYMSLDLTILGTLLFLIA